MSHSISSHEVHECAIQGLLQAKLLKDHGWLCSAVVLWNVLLRAAARRMSLFAACRDLSEAPSDQAVYDSLADGLPKTLPVLERRLNEALMTGPLPRWMRRRKWQIAIDWHLEPYYGEPQRSRNELYYGKPQAGTTKFHAYATACIVQYGVRYTLALTWVRRHETTVVVLRRLLARIRDIGLKIRCVLLDRAFYSVPVIQWLQSEELPFLMPVVFRGRRPQRGRPRTGLHALKRQKAGRYSHTLKNRKQTATVAVYVAYRTHRNRKDRRRVQQKLLFAAWRVSGTPTQIRERYRLRFGIETSYRQMRQARIVTCTRNPHQRLLFVAVALILRNLWVWLHQTRLSDGRGEQLTLRLERLRFKRLLDWIAHRVSTLLHDGSTPCVRWSD